MLVTSIFSFPLPPPPTHTHTMFSKCFFPGVFKNPGLFGKWLRAHHKTRDWIMTRWRIISSSDIGCTLVNIKIVGKRQIEFSSIILITFAFERKITFPENENVRVSACFPLPAMLSKYLVHRTLFRTRVSSKDRWEKIPYDLKETSCSTLLWGACIAAFSVLFMPLHC